MKYLLIILLAFINISNGFIRSNNYKRLNLQMNMWNSIDKNFKNIARNWFIYRAEKAGIDWYHMVELNKMKMNFLEYIYENVINKNIMYPNYYIKPFHGYDEGNLNWNAVLEGDAATLSIAVNYWKNNDPYVSEKLSILKYSIPEFIKSNKNLNGIINKVTQAGRKHGGEGAIYIFLKKNIL